MRGQSEGDCVKAKGNFRMAEEGRLESYRAVDELVEMGSLKVSKLVKVAYVDAFQLRGVDLGDEALQILASAFEFQPDARRKDSPCRGRRGNSVRAGRSRLEFHGKEFEPGQCR